MLRVCGVSNRFRYSSMSSSRAFELLGLRPGAPTKEIRKKYLEQAKLCKCKYTIWLLKLLV